MLKSQGMSVISNYPGSQRFSFVCGSITEEESSADDEVGEEGRSFLRGTLGMRKLPGCCVLCAGDDNISIR